MDEIESPYQSPKYDGMPLSREDRPEDAEVKSVVIILRWTTICFVSAAPSFVLGLMLNGTNPAAIAGMFGGILCFVIAYSGIEHTSLVQGLLKDRRLKRTAWIGYGTRLVASIIFPIGFYLDMLVGIASVPTGSAILSLFGADMSTGDTEAGTFISHFVLTITQGVFLNVLLFGYLMIVFAIVAAAMPRERLKYSPPEKVNMAEKAD